MVKVVVGALAASWIAVACGTSGDGAEEARGGAGNSETGGSGAVDGEAGAGSSDGGLSPQLRAELEEFCAWSAELDCSLAHESTPLRVDTEHCVPTETTMCVQGFVPGVALALIEGRLVYHREIRADVETDLRRLGASSSTEREALPSWQALFQGTVANGEPCASHDGEGFFANECADGYCPWNECPGTCVPYPEPGEACDWTEHPCHPSDDCDGVCLERPREGEPCDPDASHCLPPYRCRATAGDSEGTCGVLAELGEPCIRPSDCAEGACRDGECSLSALDEPCENPSECEPDLTCTDSVCAPRRSGSVSGVYGCGSDRDCVEEQMCLNGDQWSGCGEPLVLGSGCTWYQGCPWGLVCQGSSEGFGVCAVPGKLGEACSGQSCAFGSYCAAGTCRAQTFNVCDPTP